MTLRYGDRVKVSTEATVIGNMTYGDRVLVLTDSGREVVVHESEVKKVSAWGFLGDVDPTDEDDELEDYDSTDEGGIS